MDIFVNLSKNTPPTDATSDLPRFAQSQESFFTVSFTNFLPLWHTLEEFWLLTFKCETTKQFSEKYIHDFETSIEEEGSQSIIKVTFTDKIVAQKTANHIKNWLEKNYIQNLHHSFNWFSD